MSYANLFPEIQIQMPHLLYCLMPLSICAGNLRTNRPETTFRSLIDNGGKFSFHLVLFPLSYNKNTTKSHSDYGVYENTAEPAPKTFRADCL